MKNRENFAIPFNNCNCPFIIAKFCSFFKFVFFKEYTLDIFKRNMTVKNGLPKIDLVSIHDALKVSMQVD